MTAHERFKEATSLLEQTHAAFSAAFWSPTVPLVPWEDLDAAIAEGETVMALVDRQCEACAILLDRLEEFAAEGHRVLRHDLHTTNPHGAALQKWADPDAPPSQSGMFDNQIPVVINFKDGVEVGRFYGAGGQLSGHTMIDRELERLKEAEHAE